MTDQILLQEQFQCMFIISRKMKKKIIIIFGVLILICLSIIFLYKRNIDFSWEKIEVSKYIKNETWNTPFQSSVPFQKWNLLEYFFSIKNSSNKWYDLYLDENLLWNILNIKKITVNWEDKKIGDKVKIKWNEIVFLNVSWDSKTNSSLDNPEKELNIIENWEIFKEEEKPEETFEKINVNLSEISVLRKNFISNINNYFEINWKDANLVKSVIIWDSTFSPFIKDNKILFNIEANKFDTWNYFIAIVLKSGQLITLNDSINFTLDKGKINIVDILPRKITNDTQKYITIQWNWFKNIVSVQLSNNLVLKNTDFQIVNDNVMAIKITPEIASWTYHLNIMDTAHVYELKTQTFLVSNK